MTIPLSDIPQTFQGRPCRKCGGTERYINSDQRCYACHRKKNTTWEQDNAERHRKAKDAQHKRFYYFGLTTPDVEKLYADQDGACAICKTPGTMSMAIDHCHATLDVRGMLCSNCNIALGQFKDNVDNLKAAIAYIEHYASLPEGARPKIRKKRAYRNKTEIAHAEARKLAAQME